MRTSPRTLRTRRSLAGITGFTFIAAGVHAAIIFQADFDGAGETTGPGNIVQIGGTGAFPNGSPGVTNTIESTVTGTLPFSAASGSYAKSAVTGGDTGASKTIVTFAPTASGAFSKLAGTFVLNGRTYLKLNGAFDVFVRPNSVAADTTEWFRPIDVDARSSNAGLRLIFNGLGGSSVGNLQLQLASNAAVFNATDPTFATGNVTSRALNTSGLSVVAGSTYHLAFTFSTNTATGLITMRVFGVVGTGPINTATATNQIGVMTFYANGATITANALSSGQWSVTERDAPTPWPATSVYYDALRVYDSVPATLEALPATPSDTSTFNERRDWYFSRTWPATGVTGGARHGNPFALVNLRWTNGADQASIQHLVNVADDDINDHSFGPVCIVRALYMWWGSFSQAQRDAIKNAMRAKTAWLGVGHQTSGPYAGLIYPNSTENHELMGWSNVYLLAKKFSDDPAVRWNTYVPGHPNNQQLTSSQAMATAKDYLLTRIHQYLNQGQAEYLSPNYMQTHLWPLANLYDFSGDPEIEDASWALMTYILSLNSTNVLDGYVIDPVARLVGYSNTGKDPFDPGWGVKENESVLATWLYWGQIQPNASRLTKPYNGGHDLVTLALSNYRPPNRLVSLANGQEGLPYELKSLHSHWHNQPKTDHRYVYRTNQYIMGSGMYKFAPDEWYLQHSLFGISWKSSDDLHYIQCWQPYWYGDWQWTDYYQENGTSLKFNKWLKAPNSPFMQVAQYKSTAIVLFNFPDGADPWPGRRYTTSTNAVDQWYLDRDAHYNNLQDQVYAAFPLTMDEALAYNFNDPSIGGASQRWSFLREGDVYIGIRTIAGGNYTMTVGADDKFRCMNAPSRLNGSRRQAGFIFEVGAKSTAANPTPFTDFADFQQTLKTNACVVSWGSGAVPAQTVDYKNSSGDRLVMTYNTAISTNADPQVIIPPFKVQATSTLYKASNPGAGIPWNFDNWPMFNITSEVPAYQSPISLINGVFSITEMDGSIITY